MRRDDDLVMPRESGSSSKPQPLCEASDVSGILARPIKSGDDGGYQSSALAGFGEFDLDAKLDLGQHRIQAGIAGRGFQAGRGIAQAADH